MLGAYANSKDSERTVQLHSLLRPFADCIQYVWTLRNPYLKNKIYLELTVLQIRYLQIRYVLFLHAANHIRRLRLRR